MDDDSIISPFLWFIGMGAVFGITSAQVLLRGQVNDHLITRGAIFFFALTALLADNWFEALAYALAPLGALHFAHTATLWIDERRPDRAQMPTMLAPIAVIAVLAALGALGFFMFPTAHVVDDYSEATAAEAEGSIDPYELYADDIEAEPKKISPGPEPR